MLSVVTGPPDCTQLRGMSDKKEAKHFVMEICRQNSNIKRTKFQNFIFKQSRNNFIAYLGAVSIKKLTVTGVHKSWP